MDNIANIFVYIFMWSLVSLLADCKQSFRDKPKYSEVNPGDTVVLSCRVNNIGGECRWQKDRRPIKTFAAKYEWSGSTEQGDCSLRIYNASLAYDDGEWECQVTDSAFDKMDSLSSGPVRVVVRVPPKEPTIEHNTSHLARGQNLTTQEDQTTTVKCTTHYGNPPAAIRWYLNDVDITAYSTQTNTSEPDNTRTWFAVSILDYPFPRAENGKLLRCIAFHEAYELKSKEISVRLNVQYPPITKLHGVPSKDLEENTDSLNMRCNADANPPAIVSWKKNGVDQRSSDRIEFSPLKRTHTGMYSCEARNSLGLSVTQTVEIDVKYPPKIKSITPLNNVVMLTNRTTLSCVAEGNPLPSYQWLHSMTGDSRKSRVVGYNPIFVVTNTTYEQQGSYVCVAANTINQDTRSVQSQVVTIEVLGPPQVLPSLSSSTRLQVERGVDAVIHITFCSKPPPLNVSWSWGSVRLTACEGTGGKYVAKCFTEMADVKGCYQSELIIQKVEPPDSRRYSFSMENAMGLTNHPIFLYVEEPISMLTVIGIVIASLVLLVVAILFVLYAFRMEKWCFSKKDTLPGKDIESNGDGFKEAPLDTRSNLSGAIPPDALYSVPPKSNSKDGYQGDNVSEYDSMMSDHNHHSHHHQNDHRIPAINNKHEVVYADLDFAHSKNSNSNQTKVIRRESPTEYAPIQVQYRPKPDEQADI
ncbi:hypothetical protein CHUAL_001676 [Chamberlinius hualienensis]